MPKNNKFFTYKGKPLIRCEDTIYYGNLNDKYVVKMNIVSSTDFKNIKLSGDILLQLISTDVDDLSSQKIIKTSKKKGLYVAMDVADAWLERANRQSLA